MVCIFLNFKLQFVTPFQFLLTNNLFDFIIYKITDLKIRIHIDQNDPLDQDRAANIDHQDRDIEADRIPVIAVQNTVVKNIQVVGQEVEVDLEVDLTGIGHQVPRHVVVVQQGVDQDLLVLKDMIERIRQIDIEVGTEVRVETPPTVVNVIKCQRVVHLKEAVEKEVNHLNILLSKS